MSEETTNTTAEMRWDEHFRAGVRGLRAELKKGVDAKGAKAEARAHARAAMKEMLLATRSLIDKAVEQLDEKAPEPRVTRIKVE